MSCLSLPIAKENVGGAAELGHMTAWQQCESMLDSKMLNSVPALKLFTSVKLPREMVGGASKETPPIAAATPIASLEAYRETVVYVLHLVYEVSL